MKIIPSALIILTVCAPLTALHAQEADTPTYRPINPALLYWQAAALLAPSDQKQAAELGKMAAGETPADQGKVERFYAGPVRKLMRKAALSVAACDWGLPYEDGPGVNLPHVAKLQEMASLAVAESELSFAASQPDEGRGWLLIAHRMARHAGADGSLVGLAVQSIIDNLALRAAARHCLAWDEPARQAYAAQLKELPPLHSLPEVFQGDYDIIANWLEHLSRLDEPARRKAMRAAFPRDDDDEATGPKQPDPAKWNAQTWQREIAAFRAQSAQVIAAVGKPWKECHEAVDAFEQSTRQSLFYFCKEIGSLPNTVVVREFVNATLHTMLDAALRYGAGIDEAKAGTSQDAFEGEPLQLKRGNDGSVVLSAAHPHPAGAAIELRLGK